MQTTEYPILIEYQLKGKPFGTPQELDKRHRLESWLGKSTT